MARIVREPPREEKHLLASDLHSAPVNVELRHLHYFVAVAEELHFTRAARRVHIAQQPLSAAIAQLEQQLGVTLLERTTRRVELTEAGAALLEPARAALRAVDEALAAAQAAGRGEAGGLGVGLSSGAWYGLEPLFDAVRERHPGLRLHVRQQSTRPLLDDVRAGTLDLAVGLCVQDPGGLGCRRLKDEPVLVAVPESHPLAGRGRIALAELAGETIALDDPSDGPDYNAAVLGALATAGDRRRRRNRGRRDRARGMARAVTATNRLGGATLIPASDRGHIELIRELLNAGISVHHVNNLGCTAL